MMKPVAVMLMALGLTSGVRGADESLRVQLTWGHSARAATGYQVSLTGSDNLHVEGAAGLQLEAGEGLRDGRWQSRAGGGDVDALSFTLVYDGGPRKRLDGVHVIWSDLIAAADPATARRWARDAGMFIDAPKLTVKMNREGTLGFSVTVDQLVAEKAIWIPSVDAYVTAGGSPAPFESHRISLTGVPVLEQLRTEKEATLADYLSKWEDMGDPNYVNPQTRGPGHIVGLAWDSTIAKFGIDRGAGVWNDYGNPDKFRFWFGFADIEQGITRYWKSQKLMDGLPLVTTVMERDGVRYEVEQFAYPLDGAVKERRGDLKMVLVQKVRLTELTGKARTVPVTMTHKRQLPAYFDSTLRVEKVGSSYLVRNAAFGQVLMAIDGPVEAPAIHGTTDYDRQYKRFDITVLKALAGGGTAELVVKLPSPVLEADDGDRFAALDYGRSRAETIRYWTEYVERGAQFEAPEKAVNDLFRASLWHALRLPRRHGGGRMDLPYSNFAYSQTGTPWPINQAVYVDYMLYNLRGYHAIATEELVEQFRNNQEANGHVSGFANWVTYTPSMLYAVARNYELSTDRASFDRLLPYTMKAMDWCLREIRGQRGLVAGPLNDGTGDGMWAFNQAYMYAGLQAFGNALQAFGHPRAAEALTAAQQLRIRIEQAFARASVEAPVVQLADGTWSPYVPSDLQKPRRLLDAWYPSDVDTGPGHLARLSAIDPKGRLVDAILNDHEDNLFYKGWGIANEPVYNQHATAYLLRDEVKAAIRVFYSYMASAFSHGQLEPVEHRFTHGQYFGPPSTDGAWFELYRQMLIRETDAGELLLAQATPRTWLEEGKKIVVKRAPTRYGELSMTIASRAAQGRIEAELDVPTRAHPAVVVLRLRHPLQARMREVTVNGRAWTDFDAAGETVRIAAPKQAHYTVLANY